MRIEFTWNKPDGTKPTVSFATQPNDPSADDEEMQIAKAMAHLQLQSVEGIPATQLSYRVVKD